MSARFFGGRKGETGRLQVAGRSSESGSVRPPAEQSVLLPPMPEEAPALTPAPAQRPSPQTVAAAERELLERIDAFRGVVADTLYEISNEYRILCNLTHADLKSCDDIILELRRRLAGNPHYGVLAKLDEAYALVDKHLSRA